MEPLSLPLALVWDVPLGLTAVDLRICEVHLTCVCRPDSLPRLRVCTRPTHYMQYIAAMASGARMFSTNRMRGDFLVSRAEAHIHLVQLDHS